MGQVETLGVKEALIGRTEPGWKFKNSLPDDPVGIRVKAQIKT